MIKKSIVAVVIITMFLQIGIVFANESYFVQLGAFEYLKNAEKYSDYIQSIGYDCVIKEVYGWHKVFAGPFSTKSQAEQAKEFLFMAGEKGFVVSEGGIYENTTPLKKKSNNNTDPVNETVNHEEGENKSDESTGDASETSEETVTSTESENVTTEDTSTSSDEANSTEDLAIEEETEIKDDINLDDIDVSLPIDSIHDHSENNKYEKYKEFTIILITVLWLIFILVVLAYRLNQNRSRTK
ncbi:MAG: SPOR domain-containing protein [Clostridia bacterium]|nr:SPOR domain-containing protein [Clostridia bacterium]